MFQNAIDADCQIFIIVLNFLKCHFLFLRVLKFTYSIILNGKSLKYFSLMFLNLNVTSNINFQNICSLANQIEDSTNIKTNPKMSCFIYYNF